MLLDDSIGNGKSKAGAAILALLRGRLGGEERIVDALNVFLRDAGAGIRNPDTHGITVLSCYIEQTASWHGVFGVQEQVQEDLLQAPCVSLDGRQVSAEIALHLNAGHLELVFEEGQRIVDYLVEINLGKFSPGGAREVQQVIDNLGRAERLLGDFLEQRDFRRIR